MADSMETVQDFEDMLRLLEQCGAQYLVIGGLAFIYHAKPKYTKDMDLWVGSRDENVERANQALAEFGSPTLFDKSDNSQIVQIGVAPNRIDLILSVKGIDFRQAWNRRIQGRYGRANANWIDLDSLIRIKEAVDDPRHQHDAKVLKQVRDMKHP